MRAHTSARARTCADFSPLPHPTSPLLALSPPWCATQHLSHTMCHLELPPPSRLSPRPPGNYIQVWESLANNKDLVLSGEDNSELNAVMLCDAIMDSASDETTKSQDCATELPTTRFPYLTNPGVPPAEVACD